MYQLKHVNIIDNIIRENDKNNNYLGYIEYLDVKVEIVLGINDNNLDKHHVCLDIESITLDNNRNKLLAGHSIKDVFGKLHNLKLGDEIKIVTNTNKYIYTVDKMFIVDKNDINALVKDSHLTLITCTLNDRRLIIKASLV